MPQKQGEIILHLLPGGKDKDSPLDQRAEELLGKKWFRIILFIYLLIAAGGFPIMLCLYLCHYLGK